MLKRFFIILPLLLISAISCKDGAYREKIVSKIFENPHKIEFYVERHTKYTAPFKERYFTTEQKKEAILEPLRKTIEEYFTGQQEKICEKEVYRYTNYYGMKNNYIIEYYSGSNPDLFIRIDWIRNLSNYQLFDIQVVSVVVCDSLSD